MENSIKDIIVDSVMRHFMWDDIISFEPNIREELKEIGNTYGINTEEIIELAISCYQEESKNPIEYERDFIDQLLL